MNDYDRDIIALKNVKILQGPAQKLFYLLIVGMWPIP